MAVVVTVASVPTLGRLVPTSASEPSAGDATRIAAAADRAGIFVVGVDAGVTS